MSQFSRAKTISLALLLFSALTLHAQNYHNDFENGYTWFPPWQNIIIEADSIPLDSTAWTQRHYCLCDSTMEFGLGFNLPLHDSMTRQNLHLHYQADYRYPDTIGHGELVFAVIRDGKTIVWQSHPLSEQSNDSAQWFQFSMNIDLPADYLTGSTLSAYLWNPKKERILVDNSTLILTSWQLPSFLPSLDYTIKEDRSTLDSPLFTLHDTMPLTYAIGMLTEYILDDDTVTDYQPFKKEENKSWKTENELLTTLLEADTSQRSTLTFHLSTTFHKEAKLLRQAIVIPFIDSTLTLYRRNMTEETFHHSPSSAHLPQSEYYLDREGFKIGEGKRSVISYHQLDISSTQFDAEHQTAFFNLDYWRDHPMIHYPLSDSLTDYFEDRSSRAVHEGMGWEHSIQLHIGNDIQHLPRITPIPHGYDAGIIFTEHADWTDIRTHRAVLFGNEHITKARKATGGFVYYGIPVTKSVFYNNPDEITNYEASQGSFPGLQATIKTDREFEKLLKQLYKIGFDICLHTPEQYTTIPSNFKEALDYMESNFKSTTWIDHGYNNGHEKNREDMVCDGLNSNSPFYAVDQWESHGIKYLWNAYYEENRLEQWYFDNNLMQPYPGFGDALPNRQITLLTPSTSNLSPLTSHLTTWCTPSTLDAHTDLDWDYYFSEERLQRLVNHHSVYINHTYPAWVMTGRTFWTYDEDSTIIALPGMNRALARIADFRDKHLILPMTVKSYLDHYCSLLQVHYEIIDSEHIRLTNHSGKDIKGFTLLCASPIRFEDNRFYEFKKTSEGYFVWFDLKANDEITIIIH